MIIEAMVPGAILFIFGGRLLRRQLKGDLGEQSVSLTIRGMGLPIQNNVTIPGKNGLTQIDHLVLTRSAIVVLETTGCIHVPFLELYSGHIDCVTDEKQSMIVNTSLPGVTRRRLWSVPPPEWPFAGVFLLHP
ncbi:nuclease-related domain-containing protein [Acidithiobacillus sp. HP-2]|uniref:nuclease-related domain-containing protein n=1 Tax=Acidithiobacillus sp. HP-2 TaxID=2697654 RepID=UPI0018794E09|nr:nuclease-related domain-containing protein [Acidithiobacillus sp. HP-2]MBE7568904.1 NERD domain-containing protein [Acidithiobacillus sp. HP-2]